VITVDGQPVNPGGASAPDCADGVQETLRIIRLELKLCKALTALNPPHEVSASLHARITDLLRRLKRHDATDQDVTQAADLSDDELAPGSQYPPRVPRPAHLGSRLPGRRNRVPRRPRRLRDGPRRRARQARHAPIAAATTGSLNRAFVQGVRVS
jgi:hypothetical protein